MTEAYSPPNQENLLSFYRQVCPSWIKDQGDDGGPAKETQKE